MIKNLLFVFLTLSLSLGAQAKSLSFEQAKRALRNHVYHDMNYGRGGDLYCGCDWEWVGASGGRIDLTSCGYKVRAQLNRAERIEYEHILPAHSFGHQRQCWQDGGRENCAKNDTVFQEMYSDLFNLAPTSGEVNSDRSNYRFAPIQGEPYQYGACQFEVDFKNRQAEPGNKAKGTIARTYFYMHDRYNLPMSKQQERIMLAWHHQFPVTNEERFVHDRKSKLMGHTNPYVTGEKVWHEGYKPASQRNTGAYKAVPSHQSIASQVITMQVRGNKKSKIYHLPHCPSFDAISEKNRVEFTTESDALNAGFRKAGNCK